MLRHLDLFSGIGGFSLGLEKTGGFKTVAFCDNEPKTHLVLKKHWPSVPIFDDVKTLKGDKLGTIDIITGGFPCQDISLAGKGAGLAGERSGLWFEFHRLIKETRPKWVIAENVAALRSRGLDQVLRSLFAIGYDAEWHCIPASAVGAPHRRDRIWIVAYPSGGRLKSVSDRNTESKDAIASSSSVAYPKLHDGRNGSSSESQGWDTRMEPWRSGERQSEQSAYQDVADSSIKGLEGQRIRAGGTEQKQSMPSCGGCVVRSITHSEVWETEPNVGRVADGVPNRVDRLKQLGNAIVPQIAEFLGKSILENERIKNVLATK